MKPDSVRHMLITGLPRAGTTLLTALVDGLEDCVALSEPEEVVDLARATRDAASLSQAILGFHRRTAGQLLAGDCVMDIRSSDGSPVTDYVQRDSAAISVEKPRNTLARSELPSDFLLATKHNSLYTALLEPLLALDVFRMLAVVREPLDLLRSWLDVPFPIARGRLPGAERYWPELAEVAQSARPVRVRQAMIMELIVQRFLFNSDRIALLRYEDLVADPNQVAAMVNRDWRMKVPIRVRSKTAPTAAEARELKALLMDMAPGAWALYH